MFIFASLIILAMDKSCEAKNKPKNFKDLIKSSYFLKPFLGIVIGGIAGYLYYHFVGCASGSCAITSNPYLSTIGGGFLGFFILNSPCSKC
jgi:hypothetical protein